MTFANDLIMNYRNNSCFAGPQLTISWWIYLLYERQWIYLLLWRQPMNTWGRTKMSRPWPRPHFRCTLSWRFEQRPGKRRKQYRKLSFLCRRTSFFAVFLLAIMCKCNWELCLFKKPIFYLIVIMGHANSLDVSLI